MGLKINCNGVSLCPPFISYDKFIPSPHNPKKYRMGNPDLTIEVSEEVLHILFDILNELEKDSTCDKFSFDFIGYEYTMRAIKSSDKKGDPIITEHTICALTYINPEDPRDESSYRKEMIETALAEDTITLEGYYKSKSYTVTNLRSAMNEINQIYRTYRGQKPVNYTELDFKPSEVYWSNKLSVYIYQGKYEHIYMLKSTIDSIFSNGDLDSNILYRDSIPEWDTSHRHAGIYLMSSEDVKKLQPWFLSIYRIQESTKTLEMHYEREYRNIEYFNECEREAMYVPFAESDDLWGEDNMGSHSESTGCHWRDAYGDQVDDTGFNADC